jgi:hypothetical protein
MSIVARAPGKSQAPGVLHGNTRSGRTLYAVASHGPSRALRIAPRETLMNRVPLADAGTSRGQVAGKGSQVASQACFGLFLAFLCAFHVLRTHDACCSRNSVLRTRYRLAKAQVANSRLAFFSSPR